MIEKYRSVIFSLLILGGIIYLAYKSFKPVPFNGNETETIVIFVKKIPVKNGYSSYYQFVCNGEVVETHGPDISYSVIGEKYRGVYDSLNCENLVVKKTQPVFLDNEETQHTMGEILLVTSLIVHPLIKFKYEVNGESYTKLQYMRDGFQQKFPKIKKGFKFRVEYWLENPQRSIMHFEEQ